MQITAGSSLSVNWRTWWDNNWQSNLKLAFRAGSSPYLVTLALRSFVSIKCINKRLIIPWKLCNRNCSQLHRVNTTIFLQNETRQAIFGILITLLTDWLTDERQSGEIIFHSSASQWSYLWRKTVTYLQIWESYLMPPIDWVHNNICDDSRIRKKGRETDKHTCQSFLHSLMWIYPSQGESGTIDR